MTKRVADDATLAGHCKMISERLDALPDNDWRDTIARQAYDQALEALVADLRKAGAHIGEKFDGKAVRLAGIRSTSTSGTENALKNWVTAARKRIAAGESAT